MRFNAIDNFLNQAIFECDRLFLRSRLVAGGSGLCTRFETWITSGARSIGCSLNSRRGFSIHGFMFTGRLLRGFAFWFSAHAEFRKV
jgi:hypothetical protein